MTAYLLSYVSSMEQSSDGRHLAFGSCLSTVSIKKISTKTYFSKNLEKNSVCNVSRPKQPIRSHEIQCKGLVQKCKLLYYSASNFE